MATGRPPREGARRFVLGGGVLTTGRIRKVHVSPRRGGTFFVQGGLIL
jgi:hypothetical protein